MNIPLDVLKIVASYLVKPKMKLLDWVDLSLNPSIFEINIKQLKLDITEKAIFIDRIIYE